MNVEVLRGAFGATPFTSAEAARVLNVSDASSQLTRLKQSGVIERVGRGTYRFLEASRMAPIGLALERMDVESQRRSSDQILALAQAAKRRWQERVHDGRIRTTPDGYVYRVA